MIQSVSWSWLLADKSRGFRQVVAFPGHFKQLPEVPSLCAVNSEREFVDADNQTQDTEQMMAEANSRIESTYRSTISPFSFSILADCVSGVSTGDGEVGGGGFFDGP